MPLQIYCCILRCGNRAEHDWHKRSHVDIPLKELSERNGCGNKNGDEERNEAHTAHSLYTMHQENLQSPLQMEKVGSR
jgi:hypothetical protein